MKISSSFLLLGAFLLNNVLGQQYSSDSGFGPLGSQSQSVNGAASVYTSPTGTAGSINITSISTSPSVSGFAIAHLHKAACPTPGVHYSTVTSGSIEVNELWFYIPLSLTTGSSFVSYGGAPFAIPSSVAGGSASIVIHYPTAVSSHVAGSNKWFCSDLTWNGDSATGSAFTNILAGDTSTISATVSITTNTPAAGGIVDVATSFVSTDLIAHVHEKSCSLIDGLHYKNDSTIGSPVESNEVWFRLSTGSDGRSRTSTGRPFAFPSDLGTVKSIVIHDTTTINNPKAFCLDLNWNGTTYDDPALADAIVSATTTSPPTTTAASSATTTAASTSPPYSVVSSGFTKLANITTTLTAQGSASLYTVPSGTAGTINITSISTSPSVSGFAIAHLHKGNCSSPGAHYSTVSSGTVEVNELWFYIPLSLTTGSSFVSYGGAPFAIPSSVAGGSGSIVIHYPTAVSSNVAGSNKWFCSDLTWNGNTATGSAFSNILAGDTSTISATVSITTSTPAAGGIVDIATSYMSKDLVAHVHEKSCSLIDGLHYKNDGTVSAAVESNEVWFRLSTGSDGRSRTSTGRPFAFPSDLSTVKSVVIHDTTLSGNPKAFCLDLSWTAMTYTGPSITAGTITTQAVTTTAASGGKTSTRAVAVTTSKSSTTISGAAASSLSVLSVVIFLVSLLFV